MASKKEIKNILKKLNLTEEQMNAYCLELASTNKKVEILQAQNISWKDLNDHVIKQIPTQKQKDLENIEKKKIEAEEKIT